MGQHNPNPSLQKTKLSAAKQALLKERLRGKRKEERRDSVQTISQTSGG